MQDNSYDTVKNTGSLNGQSYNDYNKWLDAGGSKHVKSQGGGESWFPSFSDLGPSAADYGGTLDTKENTAFQNYATVANNQEKPIDIYSKLEQAKGLPQLRDQATSFRTQLYGLEDAIGRVEGNVSNTTTNSLVTEGQRQNMITEKKQPLLNTYTPLATAYGRTQEGITAATQSVDKLTSLILQGQEKELGVLSQGLQLTISQNARAMTGFTMDKQTKLDLIMEKVHRQQALSDQERQEAFTLATAENRYSQEVKMLAEKAKYEKADDKRYIALGSGLYDTQTGKIIGKQNSGGVDQQPIITPNQSMGQTSPDGKYTIISTSE